MTEYNIATINVHELKSFLSKDPKLCLIDVREKEEWDASHIAGAIHISRGELPTKIETIVPDQDHPIYLHCKGGTRSSKAAQCLMEMGYQRVYSVAGGIGDWEKNGYPVLSNVRPI